MIKLLKKLAFLQLFFAAFLTIYAEESGVVKPISDVSKSVEDSQTKMRSVLFESSLPDFTPRAYDKVVSSLFKAYESEAGFKIKPGEKGKVGLKVYTNSGAGMCTPKALVDAVISQLVNRGYKREDITIVDMSRRKMRECGFLPKLSQVRDGAEDSYSGVRVADIESKQFFNKDWYYDNPLMPKNNRGMLKSIDLYNPELRKSYLPVPLFLTVDFWINLPVVTDMEGLGVCAAVGNMSIWNMSNNERFLKQPANASMAAAEVAAIPELKNSEIFTILSLERGQFVGGAIFNSRCTFSEKTVLMSANPVVIDYIAWETLNKYRRAFKFAQIDPMPPLLNYCRELQLGDFDFRKIERKNVSPSNGR